MDARKGVEEVILGHCYTHLGNRFCNLTLQLVALSVRATKIYWGGVFLALSGKFIRKLNLTLHIFCMR